MANTVTRALWATAGTVSLGLGIVGAILPLLPTTPFLLLTAYCYARSSRRLHDWLMHHPRLGPPIVEWQQHRAIGLRVRWVATVFVVIVLGISIVATVPVWLILTQAAVLSCVMGFLWTRPYPPPPDIQ